MAGDTSCTVTDRGALEEIEARTAADLICEEVAKQKAPPGRYTIRFGRLGTRTRLAVTNGDETREVWIASLDELSVATTRVVAALRLHRPVSETETVDSVLAAESISSRTKPGKLAVGASIIGATTLGASSGVSTGFGLALHYSTTRYGLFAEGRALGIGSADNKIYEASAGIGGRLFMTDDDVAPFLGAGLQVAGYGLTKDGASGSGLGAFTEIGVAGFRTNKVGVFATVRGALPFFDIEGHGYVVPMTLNLGLTFL